MTESRPPSHFQHLYEANPDPWQFATSAYEQAKYRRTIGTLGNRHFTSGLEVGCSIGVLTRMLASRCDGLLGVDIVEAPLQTARTRCADVASVRFARMRVPLDWPDEQFDLIVLSEVLYFLSADDITCCVRRVLSTLLAAGTVLLVNWTGESGDPSQGNAAPDRFIADAGNRLRITHQERHANYRLEVLTRT
jgi:predicted TPR repeat methyltransferase